MKNKSCCDWWCRFHWIQFMRELLKQSIIVIDDLSSGYLENIKDLINTKKINFIKGSVTNYKLLKNF